MNIISDRLESFGIILQKYLRRNGVSQRELAAALNISVTYLSQIIHGSRAPSKKILPELAKILGEDQEKLGLLVSWETEKNPLLKNYLQEVFFEKYASDAKRSPSLSTAAAESESRFISVDGHEYDYQTIPVLTYAEAGIGKSAWDPDAYSKGMGMYRIPRPPDISDPQAVAFEIKGDSMTPRFEEGDVAIVSPKAEVRNGDYVVLRLVETEEIMAKRIRFASAYIVLESINTAYEPIVLTNSQAMSFYYKIVQVRLKGGAKF